VGHRDVFTASTARCIRGSNLDHACETPVLIAPQDFQVAATRKSQTGPAPEIRQGESSSFGCSYGLIVTVVRGPAYQAAYNLYDCGNCSFKRHAIASRQPEGIRNGAPAIAQPRASVAVGSQLFAQRYCWAGPGTFADRGEEVGEVMKRGSVVLVTIRKKWQQRSPFRPHAVTTVRAFPSRSSHPALPDPTPSPAGRALSIGRGGNRSSLLVLSAHHPQR